MANYWYSPFLIEVEIIKKLTSFGYSKLNNFDKINENTIVIFEAPHEFISKYLKSSAQFDYTNFLYDAFTKIKKISYKNKLILSSNIYSFSKESFKVFICENRKLVHDFKYEEIDSVSALICLNFLQRNQEILNLYLDLELNCFNLLENKENYINTLNKVIIKNDPVENFRNISNTLENQKLTINYEKQKSSTSNESLLFSENKLRNLLITNESLLRDHEKLNLKITSLINENDQLMMKYKSTLKLIKNQKLLTQKGLILIKQYLEANPINLKKLPKLISDISDNNF